MIRGGYGGGILFSALKKSGYFGEARKIRYFEKKSEYLEFLIDTGLSPSAQSLISPAFASHLAPFPMGADTIEYTDLHQNILKPLVALEIWLDKVFLISQHKGSTGQRSPHQQWGRRIRQRRVNRCRELRPGACPACPVASAAASARRPARNGLGQRPQVLPIAEP